MSDSKKCFVIMPFGKKYDVVREVIRRAVEACGLEFVRADEKYRPGSIPRGIRESIKESTVCVAVLTGGNLNVMYEVGLAHQMGKSVVLLAEDPEKAPFDLRHMRMIPYKRKADGLAQLREELEKSLHDTLTVGTPGGLLKEMLVPKSLGNVLDPMVIAASPLSYREAMRTGGGYPVLRETSSDYVGIRGLLQAFGFLYGLRRLPDLLNPDDYQDNVVKKPMLLYCIGSPKANRWAGRLLKKFNKLWSPSWRFKADPDSKTLRNVLVQIHKDDKEYNPN